MTKGVGLRFLSNQTLKKAGKIANFNPYAVKPIESVKNITQPIFLAHGDADENINVEYGKQLFNNLASKEKELAIIKEGEHFGLFQTGGIEYENKIRKFLLNQQNK